jgi:hypothetical protein
MIKDLACATGEHHDSDLRKKRKKLYLAIGEVIRDSAYLRVREFPSQA